MKVILQADVKNLGKKGDVVEVAEGYGRNYLLPRGLAVEASAGNLRRAAQQKQLEATKAERELKEAQKVGEKLKDQKVQIKAKVGEGAACLCHSPGDRRSAAQALTVEIAGR